MTRKSAAKSSQAKEQWTKQTVRAEPERASEVEVSDDDNNLTLESCRQRLAFVEAEKRKMEEFVTHIASESRCRLEASLEDLKQGLDVKLNELSDRLQTLYVPEPVKKERPTSSTLPRKDFVPQESLLSKMLHYDDENYKTIFNIMICILLLWGLNIAFEDFDATGLPNFDLLTWGIFRDLQDFMFFWVMFLASTMVVIFYAHFAASAKNVFGYQLIIILYTLTQVAAFAVSGWVVSGRNEALPMPLAIGFMAEQCRMSMKMHAYFREKVAWKRFNGKYACQPVSKGSFLFWGLPESKYLFGEIEKFFLFLFVPTIVYRDSYPRTSRIRWSYVLIRVAEALGIIYYAFLIFRQVLPQFKIGVGEPLTWKGFTKATFSCMGPAMASMVFTHFLVLHVVQNIGAELTRFADRKFYQDWWNSRTFSVFYRKWNGVVHDWIHSYLYTDLVEFVRMPKTAALLSSFIISAIIHEYLICVAMGFFLPILGILFTGPGLIFILLTKNKTGRIWNIFMWLMLSIGNGSLMVLYCKEYFTRILGPQEPYQALGGYYDFFIPRIYRIQFPSQFSAEN